MKRIPALEVERFFLDLEVTTHDQRQNSTRKLNDDHVSKRSLCIYMHMKNLFIAEDDNSKTNVNERHLPGQCFHFRKLCWLPWKRSHNRMIDLHWP